MGNNCGKKADAAVSTGSAPNGSAARKKSGSAIQVGILRELKVDVYTKYKECEVLGEGSMGHVARVQIRDGAEGGSAFTSQRTKFLKDDSITRSLSERRRKKVDYALKTIIVDRVSPIFLDELKNEINILKGMDHPNIVKAHEVYSYKRKIYLVLELCSGGDLYTRLPVGTYFSSYAVATLLRLESYILTRLNSTQKSRQLGLLASWFLPLSTCTTMALCIAIVSSSSHRQMNLRLPINAFFFFLYQ